MDRTVRPAALSSDELRRKKTSFTLDLASTRASATAQPVAVSRPKQDAVRDTCVLASPDVGLLALATPDLERFIIQQAYGAAPAGATTPPGAAAASIVTTPTQVLFPRSVTEEQEAYARGFLDALVELHRQQQQRQQAAASPLVQVVPDPRAAFLLPCASPSDERPASLYTTLTSASRSTAITSVPSDVIHARPLPELVPIPAPPPSSFAEQRPSTLNLSPVARRSAVVPTFDGKRILPYVNDSETLDLSPSGRFASRTLDHITAAQRTKTSTPTAASKAFILQQPEPNYPNVNTVVETVKVVIAPVPLQDPVVEKVEVTNPETSMASEVSQTRLEVAMDISEGSSGSDALLMCPIDMSVQERVKLERKREKNRHAAQKCRMLKLERIDRLQHRVDELKSQNAELASNAKSLCEHVNRLRQMIVEHVEGGCQVMMVHSANT